MLQNIWLNTVHTPVVIVEISGHRTSNATVVRNNVKAASFKIWVWSSVKTAAPKLKDAFVLGGKR